MLVTGRVQVREERRPVSRVEQRVLGHWRGHLARVGQLVGERDIARRGDQQARHRDGEEHQEARRPGGGPGEPALGQLLRRAGAPPHPVRSTRPDYLVVVQRRLLLPQLVPGRTEWVATVSYT